jgi:hydrogenase maturation protease
MNFSAVEKIANAVLYEGYLLYPYRPSAIKNQQRFNFGVLYPVDYCDLQGGTESSEMLTQCVLDGTSATTIEVKVRFLQMGVRDGRQDGIEC